MRVFMVYQLFGYIITITMILYAWNSWRFCVKDLNAIQNILKKRVLDESEQYIAIVNSYNQVLHYTMYPNKYDDSVLLKIEDYRHIRNMLENIKKRIDYRIDRKFDCWFEQTLNQYFGGSDIIAIIDLLKLKHGFWFYRPGHIYTEMRKQGIGMCSCCPITDSNKVAVNMIASSIVHDSILQEVDDIRAVQQYCKTCDIDTLNICYLFK